MGSHKKLKKTDESSSRTFKHKKIKKKKNRKHKKKHQKHHTSASSDCEKEKQRKLKKTSNTHNLLETSTDIPVALMSSSKSMAPMTKDEWEKKQNETKRVYDEATGRYRLIKGDGEVIEEIVSRDRHKAINQQATRGDGAFFQNQMNVKLMK